jgi:hypothetical protein
MGKEVLEEGTFLLKNLRISLATSTRGLLKAASNNVMIVN